MVQKSLKKKAVLLLLITIFFSFNEITYASNNYFFQNAYKYNQYVGDQYVGVGKVSDHTIPDLCKDTRRPAFQSCMAAIILCGIIFIAWITCPPAIAYCSVSLGSYDNCCNGLGEAAAHQYKNKWSQKQLWNAALCNSCMSKNDVIKPICNQ